MNPRANADGSPLVLLVNDEEWTARSLEAVLRPSGYAVLLAYTGQQGLDIARKVKADCILIDHGLPDMTGRDLAERLRRVATVGESTPLVVISSRTLRRDERLKCIESGAWDVLKLPFDAEEFLLRIERFIGAKRHADRVLQLGHVDPSTGLYNLQGLTARVTEIHADAVRHDHPLGCVAVGLAGLGEGAPLEGEIPAWPESAEGEGRLESESAELVDRGGAIARALTAVTRVSDVVARVGSGDFVIVAPSTGREGARRLADRLFEALRRAPSEREIPPEVRLRLRAGYEAVDHPASGDLRPEDVLTRATLALRRAQADERGDWIRGFDQSNAN